MLRQNPTNQSHSLRDIRIKLIRFLEKPIDDKLLAALHLLDKALTSPSFELATLAFRIENPTREKQWYVLDYGFPRVRRRYFEEYNRGFWRRPWSKGLDSCTPPELSGMQSGHLMIM